MGVDSSKNKYHGMCLFAKERLTWGEDALRRKCQLTPKTTSGNECSFETKLLVPEGIEKPELFIHWLTEFNENMFSQLKLSVGSKYNVLMEMVQNIALSVCHAAYSISTTVNEDVNLTFTNVYIEIKLLAMSQPKWWG